MVLLTISEMREQLGNAEKYLSDEQIKQLTQNIVNIVTFGLKEAETQWKKNKKS